MRKGTRLLSCLFAGGMVFGCLAAMVGCASDPVTADTSVVNVRHYGAKGDGITNDSSAVARACAVAAAAGKRLYVPSGTYRLDARLKVPAGIKVVGDGEDSWLEGALVPGRRASFSSLTVGREGRSCYIGTRDVTFTHVRFVGGGGAYRGTWPYLDSHVITIGVEHSVSGLRFSSCVIESNSGVENSEKSRHYDNIFIMSDVSGGDRVDGVRFADCRFAGAPRFNVEVWDDYGARVRRQGTLHVDFVRCDFAASESATIDFSGARSTRTGASLTGYSRIIDCTFRGNGVGGGARWPNDITVEKGASHIMVRSCTFYRGLGSAFGASGGHNRFIGNRVDATNGVVDTGIEHGWLPYVAVGGDYNIIRDNVVVSTGPQWEAILVRGGRNTVTGNRLTGGSLVVQGARNVTASNVLH